MTEQPQAIQIHDRSIGPGHPVYVVAHLGLNHNGRVSIARRLVKQADAAGADAVSVPVYRTDSVVSEQAKITPGRREDAGDLAQNQRNMLGQFELALEAFEDLISLAAERGLDFIPSPRDGDSLSFLQSRSVPALLIEAGDLSFQTLIDRCGRTSLPLFLSTGLSTFNEIDRTVERLSDRESSAGLLPLYQACCYPASLDDLDLNSIPQFAGRYHLPVGFLDHTASLRAVAIAVSLGACAVGKHITVDREANGPDQSISLEPEQFHAYVQRIRETETALGEGEKEMSEAERRNRTFLRRSLAVRRNVEEGDVVREDDLTALRPSKGIPPDRRDAVVGRRLTDAKRSGELLFPEDVSDEE